MSIRKYFIVVGVIANIGLLLAVTVLYLSLDMPVNMALTKVVAKLEKRDEGYLLNAGKVLSHFVATDSLRLPPKYSDRQPFSSAANPDLEYPWQTYDSNGRPGILSQGFFSPPPGYRFVSVANSAQLLKAISSAVAGTVISLSPGTYRISARSIPVNRAGTRLLPIYVRSTRLGDAVIEMDSLEGFHIQAPYWLFENLDIKGVCASDDKCEHAFHVVGNGRSFVLRNSRLSDFNASIKVNGVPSNGVGVFPDYGLLDGNFFSNTRVRNTGNPVTLLNINSANSWVVRRNVIADFAKGKSDRVSYAAFMKGNSHGGIFEQNLVMCEYRIPHDGGVRIGLSFGGGGTGEQYCRDKSCSTEHTEGIIRNNIIMHCSQDVGIYLNKAAKTSIYNNLLHNTLGIDVRYAESSANIVNNLVSGRVKSREGGSFTKKNNIIDTDCLGYKRSGCKFDSIFVNPDIGDFRLKAVDNPLWAKGLYLSGLEDDICGNKRVAAEIDLGPIQYSSGFDCLNNL